MTEMSEKLMKMLKKLVIFLYKRLGCEYLDKLVDVPETLNIECTIRTPEFKNNKIHKMRVQSGTFYRDTLIFHPYFSLKPGYDINFQSFEDFQASVVRVL